MKKIYSSLILILIFFSISFSQIPPGYYDSASGLTGAPLKAVLNDIISGHTIYPYTAAGTDTWDILKESDQDTINPNDVILIYTGWTIDGPAEYASGSGWTREHTWPKSHGFPLEEQPAYTDCHHLRPCDVSVNSARNSRWYGECDVQYFDAGGTIPTDSWTSISPDWLWKPRDAAKGDCARMMFYMATRYEGEYNAVADVTEPDLELGDIIPADNNDSSPYMAILSDLLAWHEQDPVDDFERNRNEVVYSYQGNRNPFIDHPEFACQVFGSDCPGSVADPIPFAAIGNSPTQIDLSWTLNANADNIVVAWNTTNSFGTPTGTYSAGNIITGGGTVLYVGSLTGFNHTGLSAQTYYYKIWSFDATPEYSRGLETNCTPLIPEPTNDPTNFTITATGFTTIDLSWIDASTGVLPAGYLIKASTGVITDPVDGTSEADDIFVKNITQGIEAVNFSGLTASTMYNFKIYPYTNSGTVIDYKTDAPLSTSGTTDDLPLTKEIIFLQDFDLNTSWTYTHDVAFFNRGWDISPDGYYGIIDIADASPLNYVNFSQNILGETDLQDDPAGGFGTNGVATVDFTDVNISSYTEVELSFDWDVVGYNANADNAEYEVFYDGLSQGRTFLVDGGVTAGDGGEGTINILIPNTVNSVDLLTYIENDGAAGFSGFDNFKLIGYPPAPVLYTWQGDDTGNPNDWQTAENWDQNNIPSSTDDVIIPVSANYPTINNGITTALCKDLTIENGANVTIAPTGQLTVNGALTNNVGPSGLIIQSDPTGTGSLIQSSITQATSERYLSADAWHFIFSPMDAVNESLLTTTSWLSTNPNFYSYNESATDYWWAGNSFGTSGWESVPASADLSLNKGYIHQSTENKTYSLTGDNLTVSEKVFTCSHTVNGIGPVNLNGVNASWDVFDGWNLIGNPYTSAIDWDQVVLNNVDNFVYYYDGTASNYKYYGFGTPSDQGLSVSGGSQFIPANQGFFVKATAPGASVTIPTNAKTHSTQTYWKKSVQANILRLQINHAGFTDETIVRTLPDATEAHDGLYDAYKFFSYDETKPMLYSRNKDNSLIYAVNTLSNMETDFSVPLGIYIGVQSEYTISFTENTFINTDVFLHDIESDKYTKLEGKNAYTFNSEIGSFLNRFELVFEKLSSEISDYTADNPLVFPNPNNGSFQLKLESEKNYSIEIYNIIGQTIYKNEITGSRTSNINLTKQSPGVYFLKVTLANKCSFNQKIIIR